MGATGSPIAKWCAIIGGILLLVAGISGLATMQFVKDFVIGTLKVDNPTVALLFTILIMIAALGGIAVIIGGILIGGGAASVGKFLISVGVGVGLFGLIIALAVTYFQGGSVMQAACSVGAMGIILSIVARILA